MCSASWAHCHYNSSLVFDATVHLTNVSPLEITRTRKAVRYIVRSSIHNVVSFGAAATLETERNSNCLVKLSILSQQASVIKSLECNCHNATQNLLLKQRWRVGSVYFCLFLFFFRKRSQPQTDYRHRATQQCNTCVLLSCSPGGPSLSPPAGVEATAPSCAWASRSSPCWPVAGAQQEVGEARGGREPTASPTLGTHRWALPRQMRTLIFLFVNT